MSMDAHLSSVCAFCRSNKSTSASEMTTRLEKRMLLNDARAFFQAYARSSLCKAPVDGYYLPDVKASANLGLLYICRAAELGLGQALTDLAKMLFVGHDVIEENKGRAVFFFEVAARRGNVGARYALGKLSCSLAKAVGVLPDAESHRNPIDFYRDAAKHFALSASQGHKDSVKRLIELEEQDIISEAELTTSILAYRKWFQEEWSEEREKATKYYDMVEKHRKMLH